MHVCIIHVCMYACMHVCMYACMYVCMYACMYLCMYVRMYVCTYVCTYVCMYVCMYVRMYACMSVHPSVLSANPFTWNNSAPTGKIFKKFDIWVFFENLSRKFKFHLNLTKITATLCEDQETFMITYRSVFPRMKNVADKSRGEKQNTNFMFSNFFFNRASFVRQCGKMLWNRTSHRWQYNREHAHCMLDN